MRKGGSAKRNGSFPFLGSLSRRQSEDSLATADEHDLRELGIETLQERLSIHTERAESLDNLLRQIRTRSDNSTSENPETLEKAKITAKDLETELDALRKLILNIHNILSEQFSIASSQRSGSPPPTNGKK